MGIGVKLLKLAGIAVLMTGVIAFVVVTAPTLRGQTVRTRPLAQLHTTIGGASGIGVQARDVEAADVTREKLAGQAGAVIEEIESDSPAAAAGLKAGDVVVSFAGESVRSARQLSRLIEESPAGRPVEVVVVRNGTGARVTLKVTPKSSNSLMGFDFAPLRERLQRLPDMFPDRFVVSVPEFSSDFPLRNRSPVFDRVRNRLGAGVQDLTPQLAEYFGAKEGVLVTSVEDGKAAKAAGLKAGDVIIKVDGAAIQSTEDFRRRTNSAPGELTLTIVRDKKEQTLKTKTFQEGPEGG